AGSDKLGEPGVEAIQEGLARVLIRFDEQGRELVAAHTAGEVGPTELFTQELGDLLQRSIARRVTVGVVELLEVVEVEEDKRYARAVALGSLELELQLACEGGVVEQIGERVVASL